MHISGVTVKVLTVDELDDETRDQVLVLLKSCFNQSPRISTISDSQFKEYLIALQENHGRIVIALDSSGRLIGQLHMKRVECGEGGSTCSAISMGLLCVLAGMRHSGVAVCMVRAAKEVGVSSGASLAIGALSMFRPSANILRSLGDDIIAYAVHKELSYFTHDTQAIHFIGNILRLTRRQVSTPFDKMCQEALPTRLGWADNQSISTTLSTDTDDYDCFLFRQYDLHYGAIIGGPVVLEEWSAIVESSCIVGNAELPDCSTVAVWAVIPKTDLSAGWEAVTKSITYTLLGSEISGYVGRVFHFGSFPRTILDII